MTFLTSLYFIFVILAGSLSVAGAFIYDVPVLLIFVFCGLFFLIKPEKLNIKWVFISIFLLRIASSVIFPAPLFSDYLKYHETACGIINGGTLDTNYLSAFPHTITYSLIVSFVYRIFGQNPQAMYVINAFSGTLTAYIIYRISLSLCGKKENAVYVTLLYGIFPASIFYTSLLATEIPHTLLFFTAFYIAISKNSTKNAILFGIVTAFMNCIRPVGLIFMIAYFIYIVAQREKGKLIKIISALGVYIIISSLWCNIAEKIIDSPISKTPFGYNIYVGMNDETFGRWNQTDYNLAVSMWDNAEKMHENLGSFAKERFFGRTLWENLRLFAGKFAVTWGGSGLVCYYMSQNSLFNGFYSVFLALCQGFHLFIFILAILFFKRKSSNYMFPVLIVLGFTALYLITETMERYVYAPFITVIMLSGVFNEKGTNSMFKYLMADINAVVERDPASKSRLAVFLLSPGVKALKMHRIANFFWRHKMEFIANKISMKARKKTGIEIHPGATIGKGVLIDHGMGVVIGETAVVGDNCTIYQNVTLGGTGKDTGKRHPTIGNNVMIGAGAKVLGPFTVGDNSKIAANAVVLSEVPPDSTCVGVPARVVKQNNKRVDDCSWQMDQTHIPDPVSQELCKLLMRIEKLEKERNN